jgi:hypothetical protein
MLKTLAKSCAEMAPITVIKISLSYCNDVPVTTA